MLLSVLILIGAILVPSEYQWLYSTHIILVCLYLIGTHRFWLLFLTFLSLISWQLSENVAKPKFSLLNTKTLFFDQPTQALYNKGEQPLLLLKGESVALTLSGSDGESHYFEKVRFDSVALAPKNSVEVGITKVTVANKAGSWLEKKLYRERIPALLEGQVDRNLVRLDKPLIPAQDMAIPLRRFINEQLDAVFSRYESWRFTRALLLGNDDGWDERDKWMVRALGLAHLFVVSGLHTGFVFVFGRIFSRLCWRFSAQSWVLSGLNCWQFDALIIMPMLLFYAYLTDWGAPVVRASIMLSLYLLSRVLMLQVSPYKVVTFALWGMLLLDPRAVLQPGLWLSFSLVCLLIAFTQSSGRWIRVFLLQLMLSTASMVLIWGWQAAVSIISIPLNLFMVPLAAFVWFPMAALASLEGFVLQTDYLYWLLDMGLQWVIRALEAAAFGLPMLSFDRFLHPIAKGLLLFLVVFWIWQWPLRRGWLCFLLIWGVLLVPREKVSQVEYQVVNKGGELAFERAAQIQFTSRWSREDVSKRLLVLFNEQSQWNSLALLLTSNTKELTPRVLLSGEIDWIVMNKIPSLALQARLAGLKINWLSIEPGEALLFRRENGVVEVRHLACSFSIFLFKSDTCRRVEKLEFMLN
ncbi:ComEC/Rec2 family competence protein [Marinomonas pollencensis]|uniref:Competence protein ComEC n=1 Tax=Marinomonas pollencensis TaxID=491954 RepID=A0A3E0DUG5_9GAMM|nr:ComEC/Rec2 family competence protein [Marinomonas pollencensis]REG85772.1 competence protein ComEC [Marinomonas pollencensis]